jgi:hypothetical protein
VAGLLPSGSFLDARVKEAWVEAMKVFQVEEFS